MRIGIDVGGTNTDAVLVEGVRVLASLKKRTSMDVTSGIRDALQSLRKGCPFVDSDIDGVMIGTTHFINALVEAQRLAPTAALRIGLPATVALPPFVGWPARLVDAVSARSYLVRGGHEFNGNHIAPLDLDAVRSAAEDMARNGIRSVAITSVFSPVNAEFEESAAVAVADVLGGGTPVSLSHRIGRIGLLERENATIINASLREIAVVIVDGLRTILADLGLTCPLYLSRNDGTLMEVEEVRQYPVATFASGPTNSMRGAALLSGVETGAVVDVGGTTSDVGILRSGFPRESLTAVDVVGIRTNFRMPDIVSIGIGGGSRIRVEEGRCIVGPDSVRYRLTEDALVFGGTTLTATDIAVAAGSASVGDVTAVAHLDPEMVSDCMAEIARRTAVLVDSVRTSGEPLAVVAVGGGSIILPEHLDGIGRVVRPQNYAVANAVGAAIAQVSGEIDRIFLTSDETRDKVLDEARQEAVDRTVAAGASPNSVKIVELEEVPVPYLPGNATRVHVKAVGDLQRPCEPVA
ncbi:hydantoinase subunit beta [Rhodococcus sp. ADH]|uniref:hydantoinase/oxoprolinase N-terminal domain-containing protein n=1 Tax=unclassified Rhodococcus (in: high G+C Gram-positive bacteria) TaxID=192944 RepID=UPI0006BA6277|nr:MULTISPECIES: hydantoinase/oxoprolinase family protein [unclassified Rhodococcus (in: high G+C Gram-positive bacteria)]KPH21545.1 hydantoinase subunit beta [Rhodococcus sp. ADH]RGP44595.1 hydantoinase subunit beta [Rhodococcus erythropolis]